MAERPPLRAFGRPRVAQLVRDLDMDPEEVARLLHPATRARLREGLRPIVRDAEVIDLAAAERARRDLTA